LEAQDQSTLLHKTNCEKCGSSDANAVYSSGATHCFSCGHHEFADSEQETTMIKEPSYKEYNPSIINYPDKIRGINEVTLKKFTYGRCGEKHCTYYYDTRGHIVAEKRRTRNKEFSWNGSAKEATLFGQNLWKPNKKISITITEGEIDAMSISQLQQNKYPVVSIPNGANGAKRDIKKQMEWLLQFKEVVLCFDNDDAGRKASEEVAQLFPPKFVRIAVLPLKDANAMLKEGKGFEVTTALRDAKTYTPDGIISGLDIIERLTNEKEVECYPFPSFMPQTQHKTKGIRLGELVTITAGTGSGKTTLLKQLQHHYLNETQLNQALIHLEEPLEQTAKDLVGISMNTRLQLNDNVDKDAYIAKAKEIFSKVDDEGQARLCLYDTFGSMDSEDLFNKIRFMVKGLDCKVIWLDHLSILVSGLGNSGDERRMIDFLMHELKSLAIELKCFIGLVVHLNNNTQTPFENGGEITLNNLRGSGGIKQLSDGVIAISRNQQAETEQERNKVKISILKCRYTGMTGVSDYIQYNAETGRFEEAKGEEHVF